MNKPTFNFARLRAAALAMTLSLGLVQTFLAPAAAVAATEAPIKLQSLRGAEINASDPEGDGTRYGRDQAPLPRDFVQQPPLIPHTIKGYTVTKNFNKCLDCHAWARVPRRPVRPRSR
jgi:cytochrome c-type protein NapB